VVYKPIDMVFKGGYAMYYVGFEDDCWIQKDLFLYSIFIR